MAKVAPTAVAASTADRSNDARMSEPPLPARGPWWTHTLHAVESSSELRQQSGTTLNGG